MDVNVRDYGAVGDDVHDDVVAFRNALRDVELSGGGTCFVPRGTYKIGGNGGIGGLDPQGRQIISIKSNMHLLGEETDQGKSTLRCHTQLTTSTLLQTQGDNWSIKYLKLVVLSTLPDPENANAAIYAHAGSRWLIQYCDFPNFPFRAIRVNGGTYWTIDSNTFESIWPPGQGALQIYEGGPVPTGLLITNAVAPGEHEAHVPPSHGTVSNNVFNGTQIGANGNNMFFFRNTINNPNVGTSIYIKANEDHFNNTIIGNICANADEGTDGTQGNIYFQKNGIEVWSRNSLILRNNVHNNAGSGINVGGPDSIVAFNHCANNGIDVFGDPRHHHAAGIVARAWATGYPTSDGSLFLGNTSTDTRIQANKTQNYGFVTQFDWQRCMAIIANDFHGNELGPGYYRGVQGNVPVSTGRDLYARIVSPIMKDRILQLLEEDSLFSGWKLKDDEYVMLNQLLFNSSNPRS